MAYSYVICKKCGKGFDYERNMGICPKCARFYSDTSYNEEDTYLKNILAPADERNCSYHSGHIANINLGHSEAVHREDTVNSLNSNVIRTVVKSNSAASEAQANQKKAKSIVTTIVTIYIILIIAAIFSSIS